ncbi:MAG: Spx/MgsR family RNA polymerase-binding regulatory protein [Gammaproteobacteria bacterium]
MTEHTVDLYGLKNCDGCRKAQKALEADGLHVERHDIRDKINTRRVVEWIAAQDNWNDFVNRRSTTWRGLSDTQKNQLSLMRAIQLLSEHPTLIKRPVLRIGPHTLAGYKADAVAAALANL